MWSLEEEVVVGIAVVLAGIRTNILNLTAAPQLYCQMTWMNERGLVSSLQYKSLKLDLSRLGSHSFFYPWYIYG